MASSLTLSITIILGTLVNITFDNMGGNAALGFARSFSAMYFCRNCLSSNRETKYLTVDVTSSHRNEHNYKDALEFIKKSEKFELKHTHGIHSGCVLNDLKYFHILNN